MRNPAVRMVQGRKLTRRLMDAPALRVSREKDLLMKEVETDDEIRSILRPEVDTVYHPVGTALGRGLIPMARSSR